ncbi:LysR family glycine cleavage system transcriptional activator [Rhodoligotrophos appendicifer]|uniref:transcriptional regulator GcvA n=1 Tax=Rhodoligotrophos appendicifer TaxID=987056 RepID=UPI001185370C|nr:transcriptional regulator GcvA [Rhodoligotrophos appendicifer]
MSRRLPSLRALRAFEAAARHASFTRAAGELFVTHAAVSRHIRELETWLGTSLFRRTGRGVTLTPEGLRLSERITPLFDQLADAVSEITAEKAGHRELSVTVQTAFAARWLVPRLGRFAARHPDIDINLDPTDTLANFRADPAELGIRFGDGEWEDVDSELLVKLVVFPVCSPDLLRERPLRDVNDLKTFTLIHEQSREWWEEWLAAAGATGLDGSRGPMLQNHLAVEAAESGQGFALADNVLAVDSLLEGWLIRPFTVDLPQDAYYLIRPTGTRESRAASLFRVWIKEEMQASQQRFEALLAAERGTAPHPPGDGET